MPSATAVSVATSGDTSGRPTYSTACLGKTEQIPIEMTKPMAPCFAVNSARNASQPGRVSIDRPRMIHESKSKDAGFASHARGVNNHMGSRATADRRVMTAVLGALPHGMYFIDSRTTAASLGEALARQMNIGTAARNVFLDDVPNEEAIRRQLRELEHEAAARGVAVGIGHMYPATIKVLTHDAPLLRASGIRFRRASEVVN